MSPVTYHRADVNGLKVFYRQAGHPGAPKLLLLHGYPSASHMFRDLIPQLSDRFHVVAPDLLGFGQSDMPSRDGFTYTFQALTDVLDGFTDAVGLDPRADVQLLETGHFALETHADEIAAAIRKFLPDQHPL